MKRFCGERIEKWKDCDRMKAKEWDWSPCLKLCVCVCVKVISLSFEDKNNQE